jgi:hypothetical protein
VTSIETVATTVTEIASASSEQAIGLEQINRALVQMDEATQQNSALVEENAATARALEKQAIAMDEGVSCFRLKDDPHAAARGTSSTNYGRPAQAPRSPLKSPARAGQGGVRGNLALAPEADAEMAEF